jgi:hypothetical protein
MGEVIAIQSRRRRSQAAPPGGTAEILFFLGVRYCREGDESNDSTAPRRARAAAARPRRKKRA